jgi:hypothetical protein
LAPPFVQPNIIQPAPPTTSTTKTENSHWSMTRISSSAGESDVDRRDEDGGRVDLVGQIARCGSDAAIADDGDRGIGAFGPDGLANRLDWAGFDNSVSGRRKLTADFCGNSIGIPEW